MILEFLDEIVTNHGSTTDNMVAMDPLELLSQKWNPWQKYGQKLPKTISVSKEFAKSDNYNYESLQDSIKRIYSHVFNNGKNSAAVAEPFEMIDKRAEDLLEELKYTI